MTRQWLLNVCVEFSQDCKKILFWTACIVYFVYWPQNQDSKLVWKPAYGAYHSIMTLSFFWSEKAAAPATQPRISSGRWMDGWIYSNGKQEVKAGRTFKECRNKDWMGVIKMTMGRKLPGQLRARAWSKKYTEKEKREGSHDRGGKAWRQGERMQRNNSALVRVERAASSLCPDGELRVPHYKKGY